MINFLGKIKKKYLVITIFLGLVFLVWAFLAGFESKRSETAEKVALAAGNNYFESGFITPASCGVTVCADTDKSGNCISWVTQNYGHPEWGGACAAPVCTASCGGCSVSCGGGTQTCTASNCSTYSQSCNTQSCCVSNTGSSCNCNACGQCGGTIQCDGSCSGGTPANPSGYGSSCNCNSCGQCGGTIQCNGSCSASTPPNSSCPNPTVSISASPNPIKRNSASTVTWSSTNTSSCAISPPGWTGTSGAQSTGNLTSSQTYTANCVGFNGTSVSNSVTVSIQPPEPFGLGGAASACNSIMLAWTASSGTDGYRILRGSSRVDITPYNPYTALNFTDTTVSQNTTYLYQIEAYNAAGTNRSNAIDVTTPFCPPTVDLITSQTSVYAGETATLKWSSSGADSCVASGAWSGSRATNNSTGETVTPVAPQSTYTLTCANSGGSTPDSVTINVTLLPGWREVIPR